MAQGLTNGQWCAWHVWPVINAVGTSRVAEENRLAPFRPVCRVKLNGFDWWILQVLPHHVFVWPHGTCGQPFSIKMDLICFTQCRWAQRPQTLGGRRAATFHWAFGSSEPVENTQLPRSLAETPVLDTDVDGISNHWQCMVGDGLHFSVFS